MKMSKSKVDMLQARRLKLQQDRELIQQQLKERGHDSLLETSVWELLQARKQGHCSDAQIQLFAFNLYCSRPLIYRHLKPLLQLPDESYFRNFKLYLAPDFEECILYFLSSKLSSLKPEVNHFVLCVEQQAINKNFIYDTKNDIMMGMHNIDGEGMTIVASFAHVIMLRSLCINWVQPVAYAFSKLSSQAAPQLVTWCTHVITKLSEIGVRVEAIITRPDFLLQAGFATDYFMRTSNIYNLHDVRLLLEEVRNCLINNDFYCNESRVSWHYIKCLYQLQREPEYELMADIKEAHIYPSRPGSRRNLAKEVFSEKVYAALDRLIVRGALPHEARPTANFVRAMSELYELAARGPRRQLDVLRRSADVFRSIHTRSGHVPEPIASMCNMLAAMILFVQHLTDQGFKTIHTSRLNNAPVETFFRGVPRTVKAGRRLKPTARQVYVAFVAAFTRSLRRRPPATRPERLAAAAAAGLLQLRRVPAAALPPRSRLRLPPHVDHRVPLPQRATAEASFLLYHCMRLHSCPELERLLTPRRPFPKARSSVPSPKFWASLLQPPVLFQSHVQKLADLIPKLLKDNMFRRPRALPCACAPRRALLVLLLRHRLWAAVQKSNYNARHHNYRKRISLNFYNCRT